VLIAASQSKLTPRPAKCLCRPLAGWLAAILFLVCAAGLRAGIKSDRLLAAILNHTPAPLIVEPGRQLAQAEHAARRLPGAHAFWGVGRSMEPLYATNTAVVVAPIAYDDIRKGMTVVFWNRDGFRVAHTVVGETRGGYLTQGVNCSEPDPGVVNENNLIGVVVQAFAASDTPFRIETAQRLVAQGRHRLAPAVLATLNG
jgi:signal peptidase I